MARPVRVQGLGLGKAERVRQRQRVAKTSKPDEIRQRLELLNAYAEKRNLTLFPCRPFSDFFRTEHIQVMEDGIPDRPEVYILKKERRCRANVRFPG
jgi:hypothetical protein